MSELYSLRLLWYSVRLAQIRFQARLRPLAEQRFSLRQKHEQAATDWKKYLDKIAAAKTACMAGVCNDCEQKHCCCERPCSTWQLTGMIRKLAGINRKRRPSCHTVAEWMDWNSGKSGNKACGPAAWDNAVRVWEEG